MKPIQNWGNVQTQSYGESRSVPAGWYQAMVMGGSEGTTPNGTPCFDFLVDIVEGEYKGHYRRDYNAQTPADGVKKWRGIVKCFLTEKGLPFFKGAITAVEESNPGYKWDWNEAGLKGKLIGLGIRGEEYEATDGTIKTSNRPFAFCDIKKVIAGEMTVPKVKELRTGASGASSGASSVIPGIYAANEKTAPKFEALDDDEPLPF